MDITALERAMQPNSSAITESGRQKSPLTIAAVTGKAVIDPDHPSLLRRVQQSFWVKLQDNTVTSASSPYRALARLVLHEAQKRGWSELDIENACCRFETAKQFGSRIEIADFFTVDVSEFISYAAMTKAVSDGKAQYADFDAYRIAGYDKPMWIPHTPQPIEGLEMVVCAGKSLQTAPPTQEPAKQPQPKPDAATNQIAKLFAENLELRVKLAELEEKLRKQTAECAALNSELDFCYHRIEVLEQVRDTEVAA